MIDDVMRKYRDNRKMVKAMGIVGLGNILAQGAAFFFFVILTRLYSKEDYGSIGYTVQVGSFLATVIAAGYPTAIARFIASCKEDTEKRNAYFTNGVLAIAILLIPAVLAVYLFYDFDIGVLSILLGYTVVMIYLGVLRGFIHYNKIAAFNLSVNVVKIILVPVAALVFALKDPVYVILIYAFGGWIVIFVMEWLSPMGLKVKISAISKKLLTELTRFSIFVMIATTSFSLMTTIGYLIIEREYGYESVAEYSVAMALLMIYGFIPGAIITILMPKISYVQSADPVNRYIRDSILIILTSSFAIFVLILFFGGYLIPMLFGEGYLDSYRLFLILSPGSIAMGIRSCFASLWEGINRPEITSLDISVAAAVNVILALLLSRYGLAYIALAYSLGAMSSVVLNVFFYHRWKKRTIH